MSNIYDGILRRLFEYRTSLDLKQADVGRIIEKNQSQLSKIELGKTILSYDDLSKLLNAGWDIDYIITEKEKTVWKTNITDSLNISDASLWNDIKEVLVWGIEQALLQDKACAQADVNCELILLKRVKSEDLSVSLLQELRNVTGMAQLVMAEKLGVNIKKYRDLERRITNPDAELLALIYQITSCRPSLFFYQNDITGYLLNDLWNKLSFEKQKEVLSFVNHAISLRGI